MKPLARLLSQVLAVPVRFYRACVSPLLPASCRFEPSCSQYALDALARRGPVVGVWLTAKRILRCNPLGGGGYDPVPPAIVYDAHRHLGLPRRKGAIVSLRVDEYRQLATAGKLPEHCSVGIHPWDVANLDAEGLKRQLAGLEEIASDSRVVAIGECGLDTACLRSLSTQEAAAATELQVQAFTAQIEISERIGKPLVVHLVKSTPRFLELRKLAAPTLPWLIHGFRGKPSLLSTLAAAETTSGTIYFSFGERFNPQTVKIVEPSRLLLETDESPLAITKIARAIARARHTNPSAILLTANLNLLHLFPALSQS